MSTPNSRAISLPAKAGNEAGAQAGNAGCAPAHRRAYVPVPGDRASHDGPGDETRLARAAGDRIIARPRRQLGGERLKRLVAGIWRATGYAMGCRFVGARSGCNCPAVPVSWPWLPAAAPA